MPKYEPIPRTIEAHPSDDGQHMVIIEGDGATRVVDRVDFDLAFQRVTTPFREHVARVDAQLAEGRPLPRGLVHGGGPGHLPEAHRSLPGIPDAEVRRPDLATAIAKRTDRPTGVAALTPGDHLPVSVEEMQRREQERVEKAIAETKAQIKREGVDRAGGDRHSGAIPVGTHLNPGTPSAGKGRKVCQSCWIVNPVNVERCQSCNTKFPKGKKKR